MQSQEVPQIQSLRWEPRVRIPNGVDSFVVPFPTDRPATLVHHGNMPFEYGHYGIHVGQEDRLTFLGSSGKSITGYFIDCRQSAPTRGARVQLSFSPSTARTLCIPAGVAHAFDGLENVHTINNYKLYLPDPTMLFTSGTDWNPSSDVVNMPMDVTDEDVIFVEENPHAASDLYYSLVASRQAEAIPQIDGEYPFTEDHDSGDGKKIRLMFRRTDEMRLVFPEWSPIEAIEGAGWGRHINLPSGPQSGFVPLLERSPFYVVDHGEALYDHDAYGIHLSQQDRLTFVGPTDHTIHLTMVDCRSVSRTLHSRIELEFKPSALRFLVIPNGVAHKFAGLEKVYTINRPRILSDDLINYQPSNDVIDWPGESLEFPTFEVSSSEADAAYYHQLAEAQRRQLLAPLQHSTPVVIPVRVADGELVRVALRKGVNA